MRAPGAAEEGGPRAGQHPAQAPEAPSPAEEGDRGVLDRLAVCRDEEPRPGVELGEARKLEKPGLISGSTAAAASVKTGATLRLSMSSSLGCTGGAGGWGGGAGVGGAWVGAAWPGVAGGRRRSTSLLSRFVMSGITGGGDCARGGGPAHCFSFRETPVEGSGARAAEYKRPSRPLRAHFRQQLVSAGPVPAMEELKIVIGQSLSCGRDPVGVLIPQCMALTRRRGDAEPRRCRNAPHIALDGADPAASLACYVHAGAVDRTICMVGMQMAAVEPEVESAAVAMPLALNALALEFNQLFSEAAKAPVPRFGLNVGGERVLADGVHADGFSPLELYNAALGAARRPQTDPQAAAQSLRFCRFYCRFVRYLHEVFRYAREYDIDTEEDIDVNLQELRIRGEQEHAQAEKKAHDSDTGVTERNNPDMDVDQEDEGCPATQPSSP